VAKPVFGPSVLLRERIGRGDHVDVFASADMQQSRTLAQSRGGAPVVMLTCYRFARWGGAGLGQTSENLLAARRGSGPVTLEIDGLANIPLSAPPTVGLAYDLIVLSDHPLAAPVCIVVLSERGQTIPRQHGVDTSAALTVSVWCRQGTGYPDRPRLRCIAGSAVPGVCAVTDARQRATHGRLPIR
jgi:hypothetical protein